MNILSTRYGVARPRQITALLQRLQAALPSVPVVETAPILALVPSKAERVATLQAERAELRADLPWMRHYAANFDDGPTWEEIEALEQRLADLDDYLIFEPETAATAALPLAA